jgi:hypothetical protein
MKLGVSFSVFSGAEFLKPAILNVKPFADKIYIVFSKHSNQGDAAPSYLVPLLHQLLEEQLVDDIIEHDIRPTNVPMEIQVIQREKRKIGQAICLQAGCNYYMSRDCDEFYIPEQFKTVLNRMGRTKLLISGIYDYVGSPLFRAKGISPLHVPVLQEIHCKMETAYYEVMLDHERTCTTIHYKILSCEELMMHHFTAVRYNQKEMERKYQGHSHFIRTGQMVSEANADRYDTVGDIFGIVKYWETEFKELYERYSK